MWEDARTPLDRRVAAAGGRQGVRRTCRLTRLGCALIYSLVRQRGSSYKDTDEGLGPARCGWNVVRTTKEKEEGGFNQVSAFVRWSSAYDALKARPNSVSNELRRQTPVSGMGEMGA